MYASATKHDVGMEQPGMVGGKWMAMAESSSIQLILIFLLKGFSPFRYYQIYNVKNFITIPSTCSQLQSFANSNAKSFWMAWSWLLQTASEF